MEITSALEHMSIEEKIRAMETIWDDLCKKADREEQIQNGNDPFIDWNQAKDYIRNKAL